jgi:hypothetical protein
MNKPLREIFLERVTRVDAVQCERAAALEEARREGALVTEEDVELFFDFGLIPRVGSGETRSALWPVDTGAIDSPNTESALERAAFAAAKEWQQLVRDLRHGKLILTAEKLDPVMTAFPDRRDIAPALLLDNTLWFDVLANAICLMKRDVFTVGPVKLWDDVTVREATGSEISEDMLPQTTEAKMIRAILARAPKLHGLSLPYQGKRPTDLLTIVKANWRAACKEWGETYDEEKLPDRDRVKRAVGQRLD